MCHKLALCAVFITLRIPSLASGSSPPQWCDDQQGLPENVILTDTSPCLFTGCSLQYMYMADLLCLNFCRPRQLHSAPGLLMVSTPLCVSVWSKALSIHPDQAFERYICDGLQQGFRFGFQYGSPLRSATSNMKSAYSHPDIAPEYLHKELSLGRMLGPFSNTQALPPLHVDRFGVIPKGHNTGRWRLITDLSFPHGCSVNDGIDPDLCSWHTRHHSDQQRQGCHAPPPLLGVCGSSV